MEATFEQEGLEQGYARIRIKEVSCEGGDSLAIARLVGVNPEYLCRKQPVGEHRWDRALESLEATPVVEGDEAVFLLLPGYVSRMTDGMYDVTLLDQNGTEKCTARMQAYDISHAAHDEGIPPVKGDRKPAVLPIPPVEAEAPPPPLSESTHTEAGLREETQATPAPDQGAEPAMQEPMAPPTPFVLPSDKNPDSASVKKSAMGPLIAGIAIVALLTAGAAGYMMMQGEDEASAPPLPFVETPKEPEPKPQAPTEEPKESEPQTLASEEPKEPEPIQPPAPSIQEQVKSFLAQSRDPDAAMQLAASLDPQTPQEQDSVFGLYYLASTQEHPEGIKRHAECVDPSQPTWGSILKDGVEAWQYYGQLPDGEQARARLKRWAELEAENGNTKAAEWLKEMR